MGDKRRFHLFGELVSRNLRSNEIKRIADVAGGNGILARRLMKSGFETVITFDKRKTSRRDRTYQNRWFLYDETEKFDAVVAMHPDQGTDHSILYGAIHRVPVIVCPCCVLPHAVPYKEKRQFDNWVRHLKELARGKGLSVQEAQLPMKGRNLVLIMRPR